MISCQKCICLLQKTCVHFWSFPPCETVWLCSYCYWKIQNTVLWLNGWYKRWVYLCLKDPAYLQIRHFLVWKLQIFFVFLHKDVTGLGGSVGCAIRLETRRLQVQPQPTSATFFRGDWSWNIFYGHSLPSADSRRAIVNFWRKNVHNTG